MVEYAIILILVSVVVVVILSTQGAAINKLFSNVACCLQVGCAPGGAQSPPKDSGGAQGG